MFRELFCVHSRLLSLSVVVNVAVIYLCIDGILNRRENMYEGEEKKKLKRNSKTCLSCAFSSASGIEKKQRVGSDFFEG